MTQNSYTEQKANISYSNGFTLVELVVAILVSSVMAIGIVSYIARSTEGLNSTAVRARLASSGRVAIDRIAMEIHNALPNSIRVTTPSGGDQCIEFIPVRAATSYVNPPFRSASTTFDIVDIKDEATTIYPSSPPPLYAVIYPRRQNLVYDGDNGLSSGWPNFPTSRRPIQEISSMAASASTNRTTVTLTKSHRFRRRSPTQRFFVVEDPVSFCVVGDKLYRYNNYGFFTSQVSQEEEATVCEKASNQTCLPNYNDAPDKRLITDSIDNSGLTAFTIGSQSLSRNSLVEIVLNFTADGESITLNHEVLTRSVP